MAPTTQGGPSPFSSYDDFLEGLAGLEGFEFRLWPTSRTIPHEIYSDIEVPAYLVAWKSPSESLWSPASLLYTELGRPLFRPYVSSKIALQRLGISRVKAEQIASAEREGIDHRSTLRQQILGCLNLQEVPHIERRWLYQGRVIKREGIGCPVKKFCEIKLRPL